MAQIDTSGLTVQYGLPPGGGDGSPEGWFVQGAAARDLPQPAGGWPSKQDAEKAVQTAGQPGAFGVGDFMAKLGSNQAGQDAYFAYLTGKATPEQYGLSAPMSLSQEQATRQGVAEQATAEAHKSDTNYNDKGMAMLALAPFLAFGGAQVAGLFPGVSGTAGGDAALNAFDTAGATTSNAGMGFYGGGAVNTAGGAAATLGQLGGGVSATTGGMAAPGADQSFWETGMSGGAPADATGGAGSMAGTPYAGLTGSATGSTAGDQAIPPALKAAAQQLLTNGGTMADLAKLLGPAMSIGSGIYGLNKAADLTAQTRTDTTGAIAPLQNFNPAASLGAGSLGETMANKADPWGASGGRALADQQLQALMRDPSQVSASDPAYALRIQGAQRAMGSYGQGSGNMAVAGANASTSWLNDRQTALANMENMGNPVGAQQVGLNVGQLGLSTDIAQSNAGLDAAKLNLAAGMGANSLAGQSLASLGYGVTQATGGNTQIPPAVLQYLQQMQLQGQRVAA